MKKLLCVGLLFLVGLAMVTAEPTDDNEILLSLNVEKKVYIISCQDLNLGAISSVGTTSASGTVFIRSNRASWSFDVYADKGVLAEWDPATSSYFANGDTIPYTFSFNVGSAVTAERIVSQTVPTVSANALKAMFNRKTSNGSSGEAFGYYVEVTAVSGSLDWQTAGDYHDVLHFSLTAY